MWVLKNKLTAANELLKRQVRLVACRGWVPGKDFDDLHQAVISNDSLTLLLSVACYYDLEIDQLDVIGAFLHAKLAKPAYTKQPSTAVVPGKETWYWKITSALYGFPVSPKRWGIRSSDDILNLGFTRCRSDPYVFTLKVGKCWAVIGGYVDDFTILSNSRMGELQYLFGMAISRDRSKLQIAFEQTGLIA
ncbi:hypothetical protein P7C70_g4942, partial [Phenoliferia sp. Uapishka_3]